LTSVISKLNQERFTALVLAAGYSSRMMDFKPLLKFGAETVIELVISLLSGTGISDIRVVAGYRAHDIAPILEQRNIKWIMNEKYQDGMMSSVKAGIETIDSSRAAFFVIPVDIPLIRKRTILEMIHAFQESGKSICYPSFLGKRGHPPLISTQYREEILQWEAPGGLGGFLKQKHADAIDVNVTDECVLLDMDTPEDYRYLLKRYGERDFPSPKECMAILNSNLTAKDKGLVDHSCMVAEIARCLGQALNQAGHKLNLGLILAAALLHDVARCLPDHAKVAGQMLRDLDYPAVAEIVENHMNCLNTNGTPIIERDVVCLSDKLVSGSRLVSLETRFEKQLECSQGNQELLELVQHRLTDAKKLRDRLEQELGQQIAILLPEMMKKNQHEQISNILAQTWRS
jgi:molybdenum cofactor cytidylyltransferase